MLRISEVESEARRKGFKNVDLDVVVEDAMALYEPVAEEKAIALRRVPAAGPALMRGDPNLLFDAVVQLPRRAPPSNADWC